jgi:ribosomal protein S18 acetylase RimI-like enzyme
VAAIHELENYDFLLMDTVINTNLDLRKWQPPSPLDLSMIRWGEEKDVEIVMRITRDAFKNHIGHFHNDTRLDKEKCTAIYVEWARNSFHDRNLSVGVAIAEVGGNVAGYLTITPPVNSEGDFGVGCVAPEYQGRGIFPKVYYFCLTWLKSQGVNLVQDITQSTNYPELKVLMNVGFRPFESICTFHKWFI